MSQSADYFVHESSVVDPPCQIGEGTKIWHFTHVMSGCTIGRDCNIGQNVFIATGAVIGNNCKVQNNVSIYKGVVLEDDVFCGPSMVFTNVSTPRSHWPRRDQYLQTRVGRGATIGANATIVCGNTVGPFAFIGAGAVVARDVPGYALVVGNPAHQIGWMCQCGERLRLGLETGPSEATCALCGWSYVREGGTLQASPPVDS